MTPAPTSRPRRRLDDRVASWRLRLSALRHLPPLVRMVWATHRGYMATMIALRLARAFVPLAALWVAKLIIDAVLAMRERGADWERLWELVAIELAIVIGGEAMARGSALVESLLGDLFSNKMSVRLMEHAATLDLAQFEDPAFYDHLERARRETLGRLGIVPQMLSIAQDLLTLASLSAALVAYSPWLLLLLTAAILPSFLGETHYSFLGYSLLYRWTPGRRQLDYLRYVGASDRTAKEVQMFGLAPWLTERYRVLADRYYAENRALAIRKSAVGATLSTLGTLGYYAAYALILARAVRGDISIGTLTFLAGSFARGRDLIQRLLLSATDILEQALYLRDLFVFFEMRPTITSSPAARPVPAPIREGFVFEDVGFRYPGSDRWAVRHVDFALGPGERLALVGENGAGKTTITKLLARLYDPSEGRILLDGVELREYDLGSLRRAIGVIFQDFVRYDMRFDENIAVGEIGATAAFLDAAGVSSPGPNGASNGASNGAPAPHRNDAPGSDPSRRAGLPRSSDSPSVAASADRIDAADIGATRADDPPASRDSLDPVSDVDRPAAERIVSAAESSLAATLLPRLPRGYRQMLGRRFDEGVDLSGGEWQKVALARAYMRDAQLLILDEPTAALDARAEYEVFLRFSELMQGRMAVLISHRFSTVRMADRIVVLERGRIVESGTHEALVERGGVYSELFRLQAAGYR